MIVLVCGGRKFGLVTVDESGQKDTRQYNFIMKTLNSICNEFSNEYNPTDNWLPTDIKIISGGSKGADSAAIDFAVVNYCPYDVFYADWKSYGKLAGPLRNREMLEEGKPDLVVAFPGGRGTEHMVKIAEESGIPVRRIKYEI